MDENFDFDVKYIGDLLTLAVMDKDVTSDDKIGEIKLKVSSLVVNGGVKEWFEVYHKGKVAGKVEIETTYTVDGQVQQPEANKPEMVSGRMLLTVKEAKLTRDTEAMFNKMDPFCKLSYREQSFKTKVL